MPNTAGIMQTIEEGAIDSDAALKMMEAVAADAARWAKDRRTTVTEGKPGHTQPSTDLDTVRLRLARHNTAEWSGTFELVATSFLSDLLADGPVRMHIVVLTGDRHGSINLRNRYSGMAVRMDADFIHFYDGVKVHVDDLLEVAV